MATKTTTKLQREVPALDVDGIVFAQDGSNTAAPEDYKLGDFTLRDCTEHGQASWRLMGCGLDFYGNAPEGVVVQLRQLGDHLRKTFGEP